MDVVKRVFWYVLGFFITILSPPLIFSVVTYIVFPRLSWSFIQLYWVIIMVWLGINYIIISIEKALEQNNRR